MTLSRRARWIVPAVALAVVIGGGNLALNASADATLEPRTAEQLLVDVQQAKPTPLSGVVETTANLGLPAIGSMAGPHGPSNMDAIAALTGTNTFRVWLGGHDQQRVTWVTPRAEVSAIHNGTNVWLWDSTAKTADRLVLPQKPSRASAHPTPSGMPVTPAEAATKVLASLDPTTNISVDKAVRVAGRPAYELVLTPKSDVTRVAGVRIAVDGQTKLPLRVQVMSKVSQLPAISVGFTSVIFGAPDASVFSFTPGPGVTVTTTTVPAGSPDEVAKAIEQARSKHSRGASTMSPVGKPTITGKGWDTIASGKVTLPSSTESTPDTSRGPLDIVQLLPTRTGVWGTARVLDGTLVSVVLTDDGRYAIGAVSPDALLAALPAA